MQLKIYVAHEVSETVELIKMLVSLRWPHFNVISVSEGSKVSLDIASELPDLVLLQLELPRVNGLDLLKDIRLFSDVPVIVLSGHESELGEVKSLERGADDFITEPFSPTVFIARILGVLRRAGRIQIEWDSVGTIHGNGLSINLEGRRARRNGEDISFTPIEWTFLVYLMRREGNVVSHRFLKERIWNDGDVTSSCVKMCVHRIRQKLGDNPRSPQLIKSHRGLGYSFNLPRKQSA